MLIETCKINGIDPLAYFKDVLTRLPTLPPPQGVVAVALEAGDRAGALQ